MNNIISAVRDKPIRNRNSHVRYSGGVTVLMRKLGCCCSRFTFSISLVIINQPQSRVGRCSHPTITCIEITINLSMYNSYRIRKTIPSNFGNI